MKNLKFKVISSLVALTLIFPVAIHAEGTSNDTTKLGSALIKQQERLQTVKERLAFKASMTEKKDTIKKDHETNKTLRKAITEKRANVKAINKDIMQSHKQLTSEDLSKIEAQLQLIQSDKTPLEATKGTIKTAFEQFKTEVKNKNYTAAEPQLDKVVSIQNARTAGLTKLSSDLDTLISLLQTASLNATAAPASTSTNSGV